jgi:putative ABC transport system permease protein
MREPPVVSSVNLSLDDSRKEDFYAAVKSMPTVSGVALQRVSLVNFRKAVALLITTMASIYTGLAAVIAFGVVYNNARISLSERARELASLRVLGFTRAEVLRILLLELAILTLVAQPPGWVLGYGLAWIMQRNLAGELMRVRLVVEHSTYITASAVVVLAAVASAAVIRNRINKLDLVAVLKTREGGLRSRVRSKQSLARGCQSSDVRFIRAFMILRRVRPGRKISSKFNLFWVVQSSHEKYSALR